MDKYYAHLLIDAGLEMARQYRRQADAYRSEARHGDPEKRAARLACAKDNDSAAAELCDAVKALEVAHG